MGKVAFVICHLWQQPFRKAVLAAAVILGLAAGAPAQEIPTLPPRDDRTAAWTGAWSGAYAMSEITRLRAARILDRFVGIAFSTDTFQAAGLTISAPARATRFVAGDAGPEHFAVVYDRARRIAFYSIGCCSWRSLVLRAGLPPPPRTIVGGDLRRVRTSAGLALGDSAARVRALWGPTAPIVRDRRAIYEYWTPQRVGTNDCGQRLHAELVHDRVTTIAIESAC